MEIFSVENPLSECSRCHKSLRYERFLKFSFYEHDRRKCACKERKRKILNEYL